VSGDPKAAPAGAQNLWNIDDLIDEPRAKPVLSEAERIELTREGEKLGFRTREAPTPKAPPPRPEPEFPARITIRVRPEDKERIEEFAWRRRVKLGTLIAEMLDLFEAQDKDKR
jgi:hypothetical protein